MCGRYVRRNDKQKIAEWFHARPEPAGFPLPEADYNIAPTTHQPIIRQNRETGEREVVLALGPGTLLHDGPQGPEESVDDQRQSGVDHQGPDLAGAVQEEALPRACIRVSGMTEGGQGSEAALPV